MANARELTAVLLALATTAWAAAPCDEAAEQAGIAVVIRDGTVVVTRVDAGTAAARSGIQPGDVIVQVNGTVPRTCAEWARAVADVRREAKALLLLAQRGDAEVPLVLGRAVWTPPAVASGSAATPPEPHAGSAARPRPTAVEPPPPPLPDDVVVTLDSIVTDLAALLGRTRTGLEPYRESVVMARRSVETLAVRKGAPPADTLKALRHVVRFHEAAALAWESMDEIRARDGIAKRLPISDAALAPYFSGSPVQSALDELEVLVQTIAKEPTPGRFSESSGEWRPAAARRIAWESAGEALGRVAAGAP